MIAGLVVFGVGCIFSWFVGFVMGGIGEPTEVHVPGPTVTVEAEPPPPEVVTETVEVEVPTVPEQCVALTEATTELIENDGRMTKAAGDLNLAALDLQKYSIDRDTARMTEAMIRVDDHKEELSDAVIRRLQLHTTVVSLLDLCEKAAE